MQSNNSCFYTSFRFQNDKRCMSLGGNTIQQTAHRDSEGFSSSRTAIFLLFLIMSEKTVDRVGQLFFTFFLKIVQK